MAVIYVILCKNPDIQDFYLGVTKRLQRRIYEHKNSNGGNKLYEFVKNNGGWEYFYFEIIEEINDDIRYEIENNYLQLMKPSLNTNSVRHPNQYYRRKNDPKYVEYQKKYKENNIEKYRDAVRRCRLKNKV